MQAKEHAALNAGSADRRAQDDCRQATRLSGEGGIVSEKKRFALTGTGLPSINKGKPRWGGHPTAA